jgi:general secretion pathway protein I
MRQRGFTLIEIVVTLAIIGIGLSVVIELFSGGLRLVRTSMEYTKAVNYARMKMEEISVKQKIEEGKEEGRFDDHFRWEVEVKKADLLPLEGRIDFNPPIELFQIKIDVIWVSGSRERSARFESFRTVRLEEEKKI